MGLARVCRVYVYIYFFTGVCSLMALRAYSNSRYVVCGPFFSTTMFGSEKRKCAREEVLRYLTDTCRVYFGTGLSGGRRETTE